MRDDSGILVIYTTDMRVQYLRHVLMSSALPGGSIVRNRYAARNIQQSVWSKLPSGGLRGMRVLMMYLTGAGTPHSELLAVPVRWAVVADSSEFGLYGIIDVELRNHVGAKSAAQLLAEVPGSGVVEVGPSQGLFVVEAAALNQDLPAPGDLLAWQETVRMLRVLSPLRRASFIYVQGVHVIGAPKQVPSDRGYLTLRAGEHYELALVSMAPDDGTDRHRYQVLAGSSAVAVDSFSEFDVKYGFDSIRVPIRAIRPQRGATHLRIAPADGALGPEIDLAVRVRSPGLKKMVSITLPGFAAALAGSAGILPDGTPPWLRVGVLLTGSAGLAAATYQRRS